MSDETKTARPKRRYRLLVAALGISAVAAAGAAGGWWLRGEFNPAEEQRDQVAVSVNRPIVVQGDADETESATPNVTGLHVEQAKQVLLDSGYDPEQISIQKVPAGGDADIAIGQDPSPRSDRGEFVTLFVSETTPTPDLVGVSVDDAKTALQELGVRATVERAYEPGVVEGGVIEIFPSAGEPLPDEVRLLVSTAPTAVFLSELRAIDDDDCRRERVAIAEDSYPFGLACTASPEGAFVEYALTPGVNTLEATIGTSIRNDEVPITLEVFANERGVFSTTLDFGAIEQISVPVLGANKVRIVATRPETEDRVSTLVLLGDPTFLGSRAAIDALEVETGR